MQRKLKILLAASFCLTVAVCADQKSLIGISATESKSIVVWTIFKIEDQGNSRLSLRCLSSNELYETPLIAGGSRGEVINYTSFLENGVRPAFFLEDLAGKFSDNDITKGAVLSPRAFLYGAGEGESKGALLKTVKLWINALPDPFLGEHEGHFVKLLRETAGEIDHDSSGSDFENFFSIYLNRIVALPCSQLVCIPDCGLVLFEVQESPRDALSTFTTFFQSGGN